MTSEMGFQDQLLLFGKKVRHGDSSTDTAPTKSRDSETAQEDSSLPPLKHGNSRGSFQVWRALRGGGQLWSKSQEKKTRTRHRTKLGGGQGAALVAHNSDDDNGSSAAKLSLEVKRSVRLGKSELGRYAHEVTMPPWLTTILKSDSDRGSQGALEQLYRSSSSMQKCYLCHPLVQHISKLKNEGGFCGYRNIQMLISYIIEAKAAGFEKFCGKFPTILDIQDLIEKAWDNGFNPKGRLETGGIRGTRKYIGTPEAQALFRSLAIPCSVQSFKNNERSSGYLDLLEAIEKYFQAGTSKEAIDLNICCTQQPPIYLQYPGHSLTIVGLERQKHGQTSLVVFDPSHNDHPVVQGLLAKKFINKVHATDKTLRFYCRSRNFLKKFSEFEVLYLTR